MNHSEAGQREVVESYVRGRLTPAERQEFEEHYFACDECFEQVRTTGTFVDSVRHAAASGLLSEPEERPSGFAGWLRPAFAFAMTAAVVLAAATAWLGLVELPRRGSELARQNKQVQEEQGRRQELEKQLAMVRLPAAEGNLPLAMLEASRAEQTNEIRIPQAASHVALWIEPNPIARFKSFRLDVRNPAGTLIATIPGLVRNPQGALTASLPADRLPAGTYSVALHGEGTSGDSLVGEYRLVVRR
ncbi:MAG: zf-HC2 domain-containing protein [Bryobacteraceae bacterium]